MNLGGPITQTICALSTPAGRAALALIRISGPKSSEILKGLAGISVDEVVPRQSQLRILKNKQGSLLDEVVATYFKAPNTYTGEDMVEISCHGNPKIVEEILREIVSRETRLAEPGEFTKRALANQRLSLDQVESLDWVLNSQSMEGVRLGLQSKLSSLAGSVDEIRSKFLDLKVAIESQLDFAEAEVGELDKSSVMKQVQDLQKSLNAWAKAFDSHRHLLSSWSVVLVGPPNSGKSSLFNAVVGAEKAIVFDQPGTTRDLVQHSFEIDGSPITLIDTAGIRDQAEPIEALGIAKTHKMMEVADLICWVTESGEAPPPELMEKYPNSAWVFVQSKSDLKANNPRPSWISASVVNGDGVNELKAKIRPPAGPSASYSTDFLPLTSRRQQELVQKAADSLGQMVEDLKAGAYLDLAANWLRTAEGHLNEIVQAHPPEAVISSIFARFCIGK